MSTTVDVGSLFLHLVLVNSHNFPVVESPVLRTKVPDRIRYSKPGEKTGQPGPTGPKGWGEVVRTRVGSEWRHPLELPLVRREHVHVDHEQSEPHHVVEVQRREVRVSVGEGSPRHRVALLDVHHPPVYLTRVVRDGSSPPAEGFHDESRRLRVPGRGGWVIGSSYPPVKGRGKISTLSCL